MTARPLAPRFVDRFGRVAGGYARWRPRHPADWLAALARCCVRHDLAWDAATGTGQAATALAEHFEAVVATDASAQQIAAAEANVRVEYRVEPAERSTLGARTVALVTVAQALHWLDLERFYAEVERVASPGCVIAAWCYGRPEAEERGVSARLRAFHDLEMGPWWPAERRAVLEDYRSLAFPFPTIAVADHAITARWSLGELMGYLGTWSSVTAYRDARGEDPLPALEADLLATWGADARERRLIRWPLASRVGRVRSG